MTDSHDSRAEATAAASSDEAMMTHVADDGIGMAEPCNVYVVTRTGQVQSCMTYIEQVGKKDNHLFIISTMRDASLRANILTVAPKSVFSTATVAIIPNFPVSTKGLYRRVQTYKAMHTALCELLEKVKGRPIVLHMHHANTYYPFVLRILEREHADVVKTVMVEEGLESYKWSCEPYDLDVYGFHTNGYRLAQKPTEALVDQGKSTLRAFGDLGVSAFKAGRSLVGLGAVAVSCVTKRDIYRLLIEQKDKLLPEKYRFGIVDHFDEGWFYYPEKMAKSQQVAIDDLHRLERRISDVSFEDLAHIEAAPRVIFANQKYGDYDVYFETILSILEEMGVTEVLLKLHPREQRNLLIPSLDRARDRHKSVNVVDNPDLDGVALEALLATDHFDTIIGLTTSTLFYLNLVAPHVKAVSLAHEFTKRYPKDYEREYSHTMPLNHLKQYNRDLEIFDQVAANIPQYGE